MESWNSQKEKNQEITENVLALVVFSPYFLFFSLFSPFRITGKRRLYGNASTSNQCNHFMSLVHQLRCTIQWHVSERKRAINELSVQCRERMPESGQRCRELRYPSVICLSVVKPFYAGFFRIYLTCISRTLALCRLKYSLS